jgi:hypothetical protein
MREFNIKDIVRMKGDMDTLYMVVDYADFSQVAKNGREIPDIDYDLMQIYPIIEKAKIKTVRQADIEIKDVIGSRNHELVLNFVKKDREKRGWFGTPDFIETAQKNIQSVRRVSAVKEKDDVIRYDKLESIDMCLDALNHLTALHKEFGDESFLQLKEVVTARLKTLSK